MNKSVIDTIMKPHRTRGESKYMVEEIYFSDVCRNNIKESKYGSGITTINPQNAYFDNGRYRFQLPTLWYQSTCNNKAIGLRSIRLLPDSVAFKVKVELYDVNAETIPYYAFDITIQHNKASITEILSTMVMIMNNQVQQAAKEILYMDLVNVHFNWNYSYLTKSVTILLLQPDEPPKEFCFKFVVDDTYEGNSECGFYETFNCKQSDLVELTMDQIFRNVWDRESIFVHASFVNTNSFGVLGQSGEFYTKPSKMYRFNGNSPEIWFELSYDGIVPQKHKFARFIIELSFIYNDADYMAE